MDNIVDALNNAYQEFVIAAANVFEAKETSGGQKTTATDTALESLKQKWELFRVTCDQAEEFVESVKQRISSECLVDEATGPVVGKSGQTTATGLPPISAVRLEQMSKAVRWLVMVLVQPLVVQHILISCLLSMQGFLKIQLNRYENFKL